MKASHRPPLIFVPLALLAAGGCNRAGPAGSPTPAPEGGPTLTLAIRADVTGFFPIPPISDEANTLQSWSPGREFVLARNPHYHGPPPGFGTAHFVVVPDAEERLRQLALGKADVADQVPLDAESRLATRSDLKVRSSPTLRVLFLGLRVDAPPLSDPRVREAIDLALDRLEIVRRVYGGRTVAATQLVPPAVVGYNPAIRLPPVDRPGARGRLAEAGYASGLTLRLEGPHNRYVYDRQILDEVARQLAEIGLRVEVNAMDKREFFPLAFEGGSAFHLLGWECQSGEAGQALDAIAHSRSSPVLGIANTTRVADPRLDALIEASNRTPDVATRTLGVQQALARLAELRVVPPLLALETTRPAAAP